MDDHKPIRPEWVPEAYRELEKDIVIKTEGTSNESVLFNPLKSFTKKTNKCLVSKRYPRR